MAVLQIRHVTTYRYKRPVRFGEHRLMLRPKESYDQRVLASKLLISPEPTEIRYVRDVFGNCVGIVGFDRRAAELTFESTILLDHTPAPLIEDADEVIAPSATAFPFGYGAEDMPDLLRLIERQYADPDRTLDAWTRRFVRWNGLTPALALLVDMTRAIHDEFTYARRLEAGTQTPAETLALGSGTCRDFAVLMMEAARSVGLAARFVSGYIYCPPRSEAAANYSGGGHTHAWVQVYLPSCGWVEFDPTNGIVGNKDLIRVAEVRDPRQAIPLSGAWDGAAEDYLGMEVEVDLRAQPITARKVA
jgi:transglutaminase-like putative cysteine protease